MTQKLSPAQKALLDILPADLSAEDMKRLRALLEAYFSKIKDGPKTELVQEPSAQYARAKAQDDTIQLTIPRAWLDDAIAINLRNLGGCNTFQIELFKLDF